VLLERESQPGYHSTGRSAALFFESYGTAQVRALTLASRAFLLDAPSSGFADGPILSPRGAILVAAPGQEQALAAAWDVLRATSPRGALLDAQAAHALVPVLREEMTIGAVFEPDAADIDVHLLHHAFLRSIRHAGGNVICDAQVTTIARDERPGLWRVDSGPRHGRGAGQRRRRWCDSARAEARAPCLPPGRAVVRLRRRPTSSPRTGRCSAASTSAGTSSPIPERCSARRRTPTRSRRRTYSRRSSTSRLRSIASS
jgi:D-arginine dehydrogenase